MKRLRKISSGNISWLFSSGTSIEELPSSFELLLRLEYLDLSDCKRLKSLPSSLYKLKSLGVLNLCGCSNLQRLPECHGQLSSPIILNLTKTNIERIPESIIQLFMLRYLLLIYCDGGTVEDAVRIQHMGHARGFLMDKGHIVLPGNEIPSKRIGYRDRCRIVDV
ncbi:hypothetical protein CUMW_246470 [Citrus unshiu]|uniref:Uncharacterized protein n=1 Tax=Citrus unshiu TaxID=55188 RepID=A0A2H5QNE4_CITUN|nr:hypothetical protein CUMW_246470 [Citrus unshiu]